MGVVNLKSDFGMLAWINIPLPLTPSHQGRGNNCYELFLIYLRDIILAPFLKNPCLLLYEGAEGCGLGLNAGGELELHQGS